MKESELIVNVDELKEDQRRNFEERLKFVRWYAEWLKNKTPYHVWLKTQK